MQPEPQPPVNNDEQPQPEPQPPVNSYEQPQSQPEPQPAPQPTTPVQPAYVPQQPVPAQHPTEDPGKLFSILGLVCAFIFFQLPGLILSIIGLKKSKKAGFPTTLAIVGICLNIFFMLATIGVITAITMTAYNGVQERAFDATREANASSIVSKAEQYNINNESFPTIEQLHSVTDNGALTDEEKAALKDTDQPIGDEIGYQTCKDGTGTVTGANVYIYSNGERQVAQVGIVGNCGSTSTE